MYLSMWIKIQQYADIYLLQNYSTYFGCHSTHHQEYKNCTRSLRYRSYYLYRYSPPTWSDRDWFAQVACGSHKPVPIRPRWRGVAVQVVWPVPEAGATVFILLMMGAVTPETCRVVLQWINICILLHLLDFYSHCITMHGTTSLKKTYLCVCMCVTSYWPIHSNILKCLLRQTIINGESVILCSKYGT